MSEEFLSNFWILCSVITSERSERSSLRALSTLRGLRGAPEVPPLCRETQSLGQQMLNAPIGINGLNPTEKIPEMYKFKYNWSLIGKLYSALEIVFLMITGTIMNEVIFEISPNKYPSLQLSFVILKMSNEEVKLKVREIERISLKIVNLSCHLSFNETCLIICI